LNKSKWDYINKNHSNFQAQGVPKNYYQRLQSIPTGHRD